MSDPEHAAKDELYQLLLAVEQLEAWREELDELGDVDWPVLAGQPGTPAAQLAADLRAAGITSRATLEQRISALHVELDQRTGDR